MLVFSISQLQGYPQEWDCKDNLKLIKYDDYKVKVCFLPWILSNFLIFIDMATIETSVTENPKYKEIDNINYKFCTVVSKVSCFVGNPVQST